MLLNRRRASGGSVIFGSELAPGGRAATMNPDNEEPFLKEAGKLAAGFWLLYAAGTIATLALALWLIKTLWAIV
jgi:hypothetical protein